MRSIAILCAALALTATAHAANPQDYALRNAGDLVRICSTPPSASDYATAIAFCHGVLAGAYGYHEASTRPAERLVCPADPSATRAKVSADFVVWAGTRQQLMQGHPVDTLFIFAAERFPCR